MAQTTLDDLKRALKQLLAELRPDLAQDDAASESAINKLFEAKQETP